MKKVTCVVDTQSKCIKSLFLNRKKRNLSKSAIAVQWSVGVDPAFCFIAGHVMYFKETLDFGRSTNKIGGNHF